MNGEPAVLVVIVEVDQHGEAESSERDHGHQGPDDEPVARVREQVVSGYRGEPSVAEGHDGVENSLKDALTDTQAHANKPYAEGHGPEQFHGEGNPGYLEEQPQSVAWGAGVLRLLLHREEAPESHPLADEQGGEGGDGHYAKSPELHQNHHHDFPEVGERPGDIDRREPRNGNAASGNEERIHQGDTACRGPRQHEQRRPGPHEREEPVDYELRA